MLPFIAGVAAGAVAAVAYNNNKKIKKGINSGAKKVKEVARDLKVTAKEKIECLKSQKEKEKIEGVEKIDGN